MGFQKENYHIILKETLKDVVPLFDYIFIDLPPSLGVLTVNALVASDSVLIPIQAEYYALEGVADLINTIKLVEQRLRSPTPIKGILLTLYDKRTRLSRDVHRELKNYFGGTNLLLKTIIPRNIRLAEAPSHGLPINLYDSKSVGAESYRRLAMEVVYNDEGLEFDEEKYYEEVNAQNNSKDSKKNEKTKTIRGRLFKKK